MGDWLEAPDAKSVSEFRWFTYLESYSLARCVLGGGFITVPLCSEGQFVAYAKCSNFLSSGTP